MHDQSYSESGNLHNRHKVGETIFDNYANFTVVFKNTAVIFRAGEIKNISDLAVDIGSKDLALSITAKI